ncbi:hypothetical protein KP79_PYT10191 [Mizuhopecten yessoensis]|uniref:Uncharacterized protein n=1 Tax=Mizuhopecten yessoensis TaxID=6573 RepID=A0A210Q502_MIZYE|nr:hypothetical protein KP79_PYT10191 [Mizuhopecten yessoensis]
MLASDQRTPYQILMTLKARSCIQDLKLQKMVTELDMSKHTKTFPSVSMFDTNKSVNLFPSFAIRREKTIGEINCAKYTWREKEHLVKKLELAKTEKVRKSMFAVSGSRINKDNVDEKRPPKVWSLAVSRTLPNINQCMTPMPPKSSIKRMFAKKELQERPVTKPVKVVKVPPTPLNSQRSARRVRDTPHASITQTEQEDDGTTEGETEKIESKEDVSLPQIPSPNMLNKTTMTVGSVDLIRDSVDELHESPVKEVNASHELFNSRSLTSRGGRRPQTQPKMFPNLGRSKELKELMKLAPKTAGSDVLPRILASRERSRSVKAKSRHLPPPFKIPHNSFTNVCTSSIK